MRLGCHAVLFRERIKKETENIIKGLSKTGFEGSEIGSRFFGTDEKEELVAILDKYNYQLSAMHIGGPLENWANPVHREEQKRKVLDVAKFVQDMANKNIMMSGGKLEENADLKTIAEVIDEVAKECQSIGVQLNYHNHAHEFLNNAKVFKGLAEYAPNLKFGLDLGWVYAAGVDIYEIVTQYKDRISYVHLRDIDKDNKFVDLGEGIIDFPRLMDLLKNVLGKDGWAVVEYEHGEQDFERYKRAKMFIDSVI